MRSEARAYFRFAVGACLPAFVLAATTFFGVGPAAAQEVPAQAAVTPTQPAEEAAGSPSPNGGHSIHNLTKAQLQEAHDKGLALQAADGNKTVESASKTAQGWDRSLVEFLSVAVLIFGLIVLGLMATLVLRDKPSGDVLRLFTVPTVIVAAVFLVVTGFSNEQITPVVGLLGTIVGYILGAHSTRNEGPQLTAKSDDGKPV